MRGSFVPLAALGPSLPSRDHMVPTAVPTARRPGPTASTGTGPGGGEGRQGPGPGARRCARDLSRSEILAKSLSWGGWEGGKGLGSTTGRDGRRWRLGSEATWDFVAFQGWWMGGPADQGSGVRGSWSSGRATEDRAINLYGSSTLWLSPRTPDRGPPVSVSEEFHRRPDGRGRDGRCSSRG